MKSIKYLGLALIATTVLGAAAPVFAEETSTATPHEVDSKTTNAQVEIKKKVVDPEKPVQPDPEKPDYNGIANLKLVHVPTDYKFTTEMKDGLYSLTDGKISGAFQVFSDAEGARYHVVSKIDDQLTSGTKKVDVVGFTINDDVIKATADDGTVTTALNKVMDEKSAPFGTDGYANLEVKKVGIDFKAATGTKIEAGDIYTGHITNTLYNVYTDEAK